jgi:uncharacterized protein YukJ
VSDESEVRRVPLRTYGLLKGRPVDRLREGSGDTPHYQIHLADEGGTHYRAAVNVQSQESPSDLLYLVDDDLRHPFTTGLDSLGSGWHDLASRLGGHALDFIRGNLFDAAQMRPLPPDVAGPDNDLADILDHYVQRAMADSASALCLFGDRWGPEGATKDEVFGFRPGNGVHDVHMNQGNVERFRRDDGVWQDGAMLLHFPSESRWIGVFLAFQSQSWHTDDATGHAIPGIPSGAETVTSAVHILAAMVNPVGAATEQASVLLLNASPHAIDLSGWRISDRLKQTCAVPATPLAPGATLQVPAGDGVLLGDGAGSITLLDAGGLKAAGVSYTAEQAQREGWTIVF